MRGIVLSRRDVREYDQMITLFSDEEGKCELHGKGLKKVTSKNTAYLEPGMVIDVTPVTGKEFTYITSVQPVYSFFSLRTSIDKSSILQYTSALLDMLLKPNEPLPHLFALYLDFLFYLEKDPHADDGILDMFVIQVFASLGFAPELTHCVVSGSTPVVGFSPVCGGVISNAVYAQKKQAGEHVWVLSEETRILFQSYLTKPFDWFETHVVSPTQRALLHTMIYEYAECHSERRLVDWAKIFPHV